MHYKEKLNFFINNFKSILKSDLSKNIFCSYFDMAKCVGHKNSRKTRV